MTARALAALQLLGFLIYNAAGVLSAPPPSLSLCAASTSVTALLAPVWQGAAQPRAAPPDRPSTTFGTHGSAPGECAALGLLMWPIGVWWRQHAMAGHVRMASSRAPAAAGITHTHQWPAWVRVWGCGVSHNFHIAVSRYGVVGAARLRRILGQRCGRTSKVERCELTVVVFSHAFIHKTLGCGGAARWGRGRDRPFRHF